MMYINHIKIGTHLGIHRPTIFRKAVAAFIRMSVAVLIFTATANAQHTYEFGACEQQLLWRDDGVLADQLEHLDAMHQAGAGWIRLSMIYNNKPWNDRKLIAHIKRCNELGIKVLMVLESGQPGLYPPGTEKRPGNGGNPQWDSYRLSDLEPFLAETYVRKFFTDLVSSNAVIHAVEMFNEINWNAFNGDLPLMDGGLWIDHSTDWNDPVFTQYRAGVEKVGQLTKMISGLDDEFFNGSLKIITAGLVGSHTMNSNWFAQVNGGLVSQELTLQLLHGSNPNQTGATNYLQYVDGIGMHIYPAIIDYSDQTALDGIAADLDPLLVVPGAGTTKPFWITECGYGRGKFSGNETNRFNQLSVFYNALDLYDRPKSAVGAVFHFAFSADCNPEHAVWDEGVFYKSADIFKIAGMENAGWTNRLFDAWQVEHFGDQAHLDSVAGDTADADGDGRVNLAEYAAGTDPRQADLHPGLVISGNQTVFTARTNDPLTIWELQYSKTLLPAPDWRPASYSVLPGDAGEGIGRFGSTISGDSGFYRMRFLRRDSLAAQDTVYLDRFLGTVTEQFNQAQQWDTLNAGGTIVVPSGSWLTDAPIVLYRSGITIKGQGSAGSSASRIVGNVAPGAVMDSVFDLQADYVKIQDLVIEGAYQPTFTGSLSSLDEGSAAIESGVTVGIFHRDQRGLDLQNVLFRKCFHGLAGMITWANPTGKAFDSGRVLNCTFEGTISTDIQFRNNDGMEGASPSAAFRIENSNFIRIPGTNNMSRNIIHDFGNGNWDNSPRIDLKGSVIKGNTFQQAVKWNLGFTRCANLVIQDNLLQGGGAGNPSFTHCIHFEDKPKDILIQNNDLVSDTSATGATQIWSNNTNKDGGEESTENGQNIDVIGNRFYALQPMTVGAINFINGLDGNSLIASNEFHGGADRYPKVLRVGLGNNGYVISAPNEVVFVTEGSARNGFGVERDTIPASKIVIE